MLGSTDRTTSERIGSIRGLDPGSVVESKVDEGTMRWYDTGGSRRGSQGDTRLSNVSRRDDQLDSRPPADARLQTPLTGVNLYHGNLVRPSLVLGYFSIADTLRYRRYSIVKSRQSSSNAVRGKRIESLRTCGRFLVYGSHLLQLMPHSD